MVLQSERSLPGGSQISKTLLIAALTELLNLRSYTLHFLPTIKNKTLILLGIIVLFKVTDEGKKNNNAFNYQSLHQQTIFTTYKRTCRLLGHAATIYTVSPIDNYIRVICATKQEENPL
jgi:hypothetical protein